MAELAAAFQCSERDIRQQILNERKAGFLICSGSAGYFLPANEKEIETFIATKKKFIFSSWAAISPALAAMKIDPDQMTITEFLEMKKESVMTL